MVEVLPELIDPIAMADKGRRMAGVLPLSRFARLKGLLASAQGEVALELEFGKEERFRVIKAHVVAELRLPCQCCLDELRWPVDVSVRLGIVHTLDEAAQLPDSLEPLLLEQEVIWPGDIAQDELLLSIPDVPRHAGCSVKKIEESDTMDEVSAKENPFSILSKLKQ